jgi:hypothetical protein
MATVPYVSDLSALTPADRLILGQLGARLLNAIESTTELDDGYAFQLAAGGMSLEELGHLIRLERLCSPFLGYDVELSGDGKITVLITGAGDAIKEFIRDDYPRRFR